MLHRQTPIRGQARVEHWQVAEAAEQGGIRLEVDRVAGASLVLAVRSVKSDVL